MTKVKTAGIYIQLENCQNIAECQSSSWAEIIANAVNTQDELVLALEKQKQLLIDIMAGRKGFAYEATCAVKNIETAIAKAKGEL